MLTISRLENIFWIQIGAVRLGMYRFKRSEMENQGPPQIFIPKYIFWSWKLSLGTIRNSQIKNERYLRLF